MKKLLLLIFILAGISSASFAGVSQQERKQRQRNDNMTKELNLTEEQQKKIDALRTDFRDKAKKINDDKKLNDSDRKTKRNAIREEHQKAIKEVLTPEQQEKWEKMRKDRPSNRKMRDGDAKKNKESGQRMNRGKGKMQAQHRASKPRMDLNLTETQKNSIKELREEYKIKRKALASERQIKIDQILTPEQKAKREEFRKQRPQNIKGDKPFAGKRNPKMERKLDDESLKKLKDLNNRYKEDKKKILNEAKNTNS
ncbi:hypothetical protein D0T53_00305 [Dysgonomonas sp. 216]|uniref:Spy/CpxP family protein refolding chaperone n=1 Tax=Dysgonomonas sp. 216 TaxID=2302934 RepID=UPI0013CFB084|nr:DUF1682 domain-containing protein [Dysgonomonas sp. 216]NDW17355.1 hypothetical protein [Dysgonomonas sp. 216]